MSHKAKISIELELSESFLSDILVTAFDGSVGGCWYWARPYETKEHVSALELDENKEFAAVTITLKDFDGVEAKPFMSPGGNGVIQAYARVDHATLVMGIERLFRQGVLPERGDIREAILLQDAGDIDSDAADVIVQLAVFGVLVFG